MTCIIIDDEPLALDILETYIADSPTLRLVARCENALEAFQALQQHEPELIFLDIQMPQLTGIELLRSLKNPPQVIFTTAYPNYALEGYELNITDYLLKPFSPERFAAAVQKASQKAIESSHLPHLQHFASIGGHSPEEDYVFVKSDKKLIRVRLADIYYIEGLKDYVMIYTTTGRIVTLQTMKSLEDRLPSDRFRRIHRSFIVSMEHIESVDGTSVEIQKKELPIGKNYKDELLEEVQKRKI